MRKVSVVLFLVAAWWAQPAIGQDVSRSSVRGRVVATDGTPIQRAHVEVPGRPDTTSTSSSGEFDLRLVTGDSVVIRVRAIGYSPSTRGIRVAATGVSLGTIVLERSVARLDLVTVHGKPDSFAHTTKYDDYFRRRKLAHGVFREQQDFLRMGASDVVGALHGIAGVNVSWTSDPNGAPEVRFRMARCSRQPPNISVYVNGTEVPYFARNSENSGSELSGMTFRKPKEKGGGSSCEDCQRLAAILSGLALTDILFIEFYRGPGQIPSDVDRGDSCAALMIWTR